MKMRLLLSAAFVLATAQAAAAQAFLSIGTGVAVAGPVGGTHPTHLGAIGTFGGFAGFEAEYGFTVHMLGGEGIGDHYRTASGQLMLGPKIGRFHPYGSIGGGIVGAVGMFKDIFSIDREFNVLAASAGGGVFVPLHGSLSVRGDARYFRALTNPKNTPAELPKITFVRVSGSLVWAFSGASK